MGLFGLIVSVNSKGYIGKNNQLIYYNKEDMRHFKTITDNSVVVMGYNTYISMNCNPLPNRYNIVLTNKHLHNTSNTQFTNNVNDVLELSKYNDVWIIGGSSVYKLFEPYYNIAYITTNINSDIGDTLFPTINLDNFTKTTILTNKHISIDKYEICNRYRN